ncbi:hypothetical protein HPB48_020783 [Haemaphysalis longicornis]|uniref:Peptidase M13 N-terminal domain-containing protein n=1 Tax=Haemaphysalis longicornis TaxID=44386 RepID=A0A9J6FCI4_HAELO|nr:hypothetical protein HPB48_020783 [Haemaphysalis longicornis]
MRDLLLDALIDVSVGFNPSVIDSLALQLQKPTYLFSRNDASRNAVKQLFMNALKDTALAFTQRPAQDVLEEVISAFIRLGSSPLQPSFVELGAGRRGGSIVVKLSELDGGITKFLHAATSNIITVAANETVVLKYPDYIRDQLPSVLREMSPRALMNYLGLLVLVRLAPFLPDQQNSLRQLFTKSVRGTTRSDIADSDRLCLMAVEQVLPGCLGKLSTEIFKQSKTDLHVREKLTEIENVFSRNLRSLAWMNEYQALINRYHIKRRPLSHFGPGNGSCAPTNHSFPIESPVNFYRDLARLRVQARFAPVAVGRAASNANPLDSSPLSTQASYDSLRRLVFAPAALFNASVPPNSTFFSLHMARFAVRVYRALVRKLFEGAVEPDLAHSYSEELLRKLGFLLRCFQSELQQLPSGLRGPVAPDASLSRGAVLQQTVAVQMAYRAFRELLQVSQCAILLTPQPAASFLSEPILCHKREKSYEIWFWKMPVYMVRVEVPSCLQVRRTYVY